METIALLHQLNKFATNLQPYSSSYTNWLITTSLPDMTNLKTATIARKSISTARKLLAKSIYPL